MKRPVFRVLLFTFPGAKGVDTISPLAAAVAWVPMGLVEVLEFCHFDGINGTLAAFVAILATTAILGLVQVVGGEQSVDDGNVLVGVEAGYAVSNALADVVEVGRFAADDAA